MRLAAAMSGGVDSAVAAARAIAAGHDVVGVHLALTKERPQDRCGSRGCCSVSDSNDALPTDSQTMLLPTSLPNMPQAEPQIRVFGAMRRLNLPQCLIRSSRSDSMA